MDFLPRPDARGLERLKLKNENSGKKWAVGEPLSPTKETTQEAERVFKFPRIEACFSYIRGRGYLNGDSAFMAFIVAYIAGLINVLSQSAEEMQQLDEFERWFLATFPHPSQLTKFAWDHPEIPAFFAVAYMAMLWLGPKLMANYERPKWLKKYIISWNVLLVVFSTIGSYKIAKTLWLSFDIDNMHGVACKDGRGQCFQFPSGCIWLFFFCASKIPEMLDTVFLIVMKKKPIFLHWFHHVTVMLFCWLSYATHTPVGTVFAGMNYFVHSWMYTWYGLAAYGLKPTRYMSQMVTVLQIVQMLFGSALAFYVYFKPNCENHIYATTAGIMIYGSYLFLFVKFFITAYCRKRVKKSKELKFKTKTS